MNCVAHGAPIFPDVNVGESTVFAKYLFLGIPLFRRIASNGDVQSTDGRARLSDCLEVYVKPVLMIDNNL